MRNSIAFTLFFACATLPAQETRRPEVVSLLGKSYSANPSTDAVKAAEKSLSEKPDDPDRMIAAGRAYDGILQFSASIPLYTRVIGMLPSDVQAYRYRGHRYISTRRFADAITDLSKAEKIAPDSFDVLYHLALAQYLSGRFGEAADSHLRCLSYAGKSTSGTQMPKEWRSCAGLDDESRVAMLNWRYAALRRAGRHEEARKLLDAVNEGLPIKENAAYLQALLFYKGERSADVFETASFTGSSLMALGYPVANFALINGDTSRACELFRKLLADDANWAAFGFIAAEVELSRPGPCKAK
jgi:tetratricopeptide (TPR) repeat protein